MSVATSAQPIAIPTPAVAVIPIVAAVFAGYLVIGIAMPVLPLHVHNGLGFSAFVVGSVSGSQFAATLASRMTAGYFADRRGAKRAVVTGLMSASAAGVLYAVSLRVADSRGPSLALLLAGRAVLGGAESFMIAGALNWCLALMGPQHTGRVMAWVGTAMYVAYAVGAPLGNALFAVDGFVAIAGATILVPLLPLALVAWLRPVDTARGPAPVVGNVARMVWFPGLGLALCSVGFGAITIFTVLLFAANGWTQAWIAITAVSVGFIAVRLMLGHLPDRLGGPKIALICVLIEASGLALMWWAASPPLVFAGAALAGAGYALVYPGFGIEAVRRVPAAHRGLAMGVYTACLDLALGIAGPLLGLIAREAGIRAVFLVSTGIVLAAAIVATMLIVSSRPKTQGEHS